MSLISRSLGFKDIHFLVPHKVEQESEYLLCDDDVSNFNIAGEGQGMTCLLELRGERLSGMIRLSLNARTFCILRLV